jgi:hypothetical protein
MGSDAEQRDWLKRVLGIDVDASTTRLVPLWLATKDALDARVSDLQVAVRGTNTELGRAVADAGLVGLTDGIQVKLLTALMDHDQAGGTDRAVVERTRAAIADARAAVNGDALFQLLDENPWRVEVGFRAGIARLSDTIEQHLGRGPQP